MRISELKIENFRIFKSETIRFGNYTSFVGPNGAGKSSILTALRIFFRDTADTATDLQTLSVEDFHNKDTGQDIVISVTFEDLSAEAQEDLQHYYRHGKLVVSAVAHWNSASKSAEVNQFGERLGIKDFTPFYEAEGNASDLRVAYEKMRASHQGLPERKTKPQMTDALLEYEAAHPDQCVPIRSRGQFYGFTKGESHLKSISSGSSYLQ